MQALKVSNPRISVLLPVYNCERFLAQAIESVLKQTYTNFELIVICECDCNQQSINIVKAYEQKDSRIILIFNSCRLGIAASLNKGLQVSRGEFIARMDGDDLSRPRRFERQLDYMLAHPTVAVLGCEVHYIDQHDRVIQKRDHFPRSPDQVCSELLFYCCVRHPTVFMRKQAFIDLNIRYDPVLTASEDFDLWNRCGQHLPISNLKEVLLLYRWYPGNATHQRDELGIRNYIAVMDRSFKKMGLHLTQNELQLLCPITCKLEPDNYRESCRALEELGERILRANAVIGLYNPRCLERTVHKRLYWKCHPIRLRAVICSRWIEKTLTSCFPHKTAHLRYIGSVATYLETNGFARTATRICRQVAVKMVSTVRGSK